MSDSSTLTIRAWLAVRHAVEPLRTRLHSFLDGRAWIVSCRRQAYGRGSGARSIREARCPPFGLGVVVWTAEFEVARSGRSGSFAMAPHFTALPTPCELNRRTMQARLRIKIVGPKTDAASWVAFFSRATRAADRSCRPRRSPRGGDQLANNVWGRCKADLFSVDFAVPCRMRLRMELHSPPFRVVWIPGPVGRITQSRERTRDKGGKTRSNG